MTARRRLPAGNRQSRHARLQAGQAAAHRGGTGPDVSFFEVEIAGDAKLAARSSLRPAEVTQNVATIGYPAYDSRIPEPDLMEQIYGKTYNKKRLAPGGVTRRADAHPPQLHDARRQFRFRGARPRQRQGARTAFQRQFPATNYAVRADIVKQLLRCAPRRAVRRRRAAAAAAAHVPHRAAPAAPTAIGRHRQRNNSADRDGIARRRPTRAAAPLLSAARGRSDDGRPDMRSKGGGGRRRLPGPCRLQSDFLGDKIVVELPSSRATRTTFSTSKSTASPTPNCATSTTPW